MLQKHLDSQKNLILPENSNKLVSLDLETGAKKNLTEDSNSATEATHRSETENINPSHSMENGIAENTCGTANDTRQANNIQKILFEHHQPSNRRTLRYSEAFNANIV